MRVALVCSTYAPARDGVADYVRRLADELPAVGVHPVLAAQAGAELAAEPRAVAVTRSWTPRHIAGAARRLDALGCDLVHVHFAPSAYGFSPGVGWLPLTLRTPLVTTLHEYGWWAWPSRIPEQLWRRLERGGRYDRESGLLGPRSHEVIATNTPHAVAVHARLGRTATVIPIGPNVPGPGTDPSRAAARVRSRFGLAGGFPLLVFFGFVHPIKGVRELIDAVARLRAEGRDVYAVVAGGFASLALRGAEAASFRAEVEARIDDRGVADRVFLTGWLPGEEISELLSAADAVVLPFTAGVTTKSGSLLAALAHGAVVLATAADDPDPDLVDGDTVFTITRRRDPGAIAAAIAHALDDPVAAAAVARRGAALADSRRWPVLAAAHAAMYAKVLGR